MRWGGLRNGALLRRAEGEFDALVTADKHLRFQQNIVAFDIGVIVLRTGSTKIADLVSLAPKIVEAADAIYAGAVLEVN